MIRSFADGKTRRFYEEGKTAKFRSLNIEAAEDLPTALDAVCFLQNLSPLKSVGLHKLTGNRLGQSDYHLCSARVRGYLKPIDIWGKIQPINKNRFVE